MEFIFNMIIISHCIAIMWRKLSIERVIGQCADIVMPPHLSHILLISFMWVIHQGFVHFKKPQTIEQLKIYTVDTFQDLKNDKDLCLNPLTVSNVILRQ